MTATLTNQDEKQKSRVGPVVLAALVGLAPLALLFVPAVQEALAGVLDLGYSAGDVSYDPAHPLVLSESHGFPTSLIVTGMVLMLGVLSGVIAWGVLYFGFSFRPNDDSTLFTGLVVGFVGVVIALPVISTGVHPLTQSGPAEDAQPARVTQWADGRYGLTLSESDAEALVEQGHYDDGDPVLIEGRLLNLTRVAQGGYVLTEDRTATELPTTDMEGDS